MPVLAVFDAEGRWCDTHVCDGRINEHLGRQGVSWGREGAPAGLRPLERASLFYVRTDDGYLGLLFEAGEWVALVGRRRALSSTTAMPRRPGRCPPRCRTSTPSSKRC